ncbi:hypothetical protein BpHYR1_008169 [Brachionus plicatilis]|uniref:Uncharacterized protein n=1 Tax=Brachionus plicatilis TaxID=10195 RepID=A0A3M7PR55_BRAPC|nr:hypothetical protein BpHYR1_008169 [Brachionus plicatilis]
MIFSFWSSTSTLNRTSSVCSASIRASPVVLTIPLDLSTSNHLEYKSWGDENSSFSLCIWMTRSSKRESEFESILTIRVVVLLRLSFSLDTALISRA